MVLLYKNKGPIKRGPFTLFLTRCLITRYAVYEYDYNATFPLRTSSIPLIRPKKYIYVAA